MPTTCCAFIKPDGNPCAAHPVTGSKFCLFHDPAHQQTLAESRSKGGSTPRRRFRRYPRLLDHLHVAELLSEIFIDALNDPEAIDTKRLRALTHLAQVLLKAVGIPKDEPFVSRDREPTAADDHLLRIYPPQSEDPTDLDRAELLLELRPDPPSTPSTEPPSPTVSPIPSASAVPLTPAARLSPPVPQHGEQAVPQERNRLSTGSPAIRLSSIPWPANSPLVSPPIPGSAPADYPSFPIDQERIPVRFQAAEQALNRSRTGLPATRDLRSSSPAANAQASLSSQEPTGRPHLP